MSVSDRSPLGENRHRTMMRALLLSTALASLGGVSAAYAEGSAPVKTARESTTAAAAAAPATGLGEVVVTARKREENLQTVPVSATVIGAGDLTKQNLVNFQDLRGAVPDLQVTPIASGVGTNLTIRGVGQGSFQVNADPKTGLYVDEMYIARPEGNSLSFYDLSSVQLLYGPQGTLFGRNTTGGALVVTTARPSAAEGSSYVQARFGNFSRIDTEGGINVPVSDTLATRFSFRTESAKGYLMHVLDDGRDNNINDKSFRAQARWTPTSKFTGEFLFEHDESATTGVLSTLTGCLTGGGYIPNYNALHTVPYCAQYPVLPGKYQVYGGASFTGPTSAVQTPIATGGDFNPGGLTPYGHPSPFLHILDNTFNMRLKYALTPDIDLKSITAVRRSAATKYSPTVDAPNDIYQERDNSPTQQITQEINLTGKALNSRLNYVFGVYYFNQHTTFLQFSGTDWTDPSGYNDYETNIETSYAAYGQASFDVTPQLEVTAGGRFTRDYKKAGAKITFANQIASNVPVGCTYFLGDFKLGNICNQTLLGKNNDVWKNFDPMGSIRYKITPDVSIYGTIRSAYNEGGFNSHALKVSYAGSIPEYAPEHFIDYEGGIKSEWFDHTLRLNVDGYYEKFSDIQVTTVVTVNGIATRSTGNAATAHYEGLEASLTWAPTRDFTLSANGSYFKAGYDSIGTGVTTISLATPIVGVAAPKYTFGLAASYTVHPTDDARLTFNLDYKATASLLSCPNGTPQTYTCSIPAYGLLGGRIDFKPSADSPWTFGVWGSNLTNSYWLLSKNVVNPLSINMGVSSDTPGSPRTYGVVVRRTF